MDTTLLIALVTIPALVVAIVFHEVAHGWTALALGDPTAKEQRRLSFNPLRHVDPIGTLILPGILYLSGAPVFGWAKPVPVIKQRLRNPRFGMMAVAAAGPGTNFLLAIFAAIALGLLARSGVEPEGATGIAVASLSAFILINLFLGLFNLLPLPPFDGSHIVEGLLPPRAARIYEKLRPFGFPLLFLLLLVIPYFFPELGIVERVVVPPVTWAEKQVLTLAMWVAGL
jgi:Zn-dependent protease